MDGPVHACGRAPRTPSPGPGSLDAGQNAAGAIRQAKFFAAKSQLASEFRKVSTNFGRALRKSM